MKKNNAILIKKMNEATKNVLMSGLTPEEQKKADKEAFIAFLIYIAPLVFGLIVSIYMLWVLK